MLTTEQKNDLRKRVLAGQPLTVAEAREVIESCKNGQSVATAIAGEKKSKKPKGPACTDEQLDKDLEGLGI
jgi:hypothetical protein